MGIDVVYKCKSCGPDGCKFIVKNVDPDYSFGCDGGKCPIGGVAKFKRVKNKSNPIKKYRKFQCNACNTSEPCVIKLKNKCNRLVSNPEKCLWEERINKAKWVEID